MANTPKKTQGGPRAAQSAKKKPASAAASKALKSAGAASNKGKGPAGRGRDSKVVARRPKPWGLIAGALAVLVFAAAAVGYAVFQVNESNAEKAANDPTKIEGVLNADYTAAQHSDDDQTYEQTPPVGGVHNPAWADCTGTVYPTEIKKENAVHSLEHGAIWVTYDPSLDAASIDKLKALVDGQEFMLMSPFPGIGAKFSLQAWGHQLKLDNPDDPRGAKFIAGFRHNETYTPEFGATCDNPEFKANPATPSDSGNVGSTDAPATPSASAPSAPATQG